jgi:hypothetical protein
MKLSYIFNERKTQLDKQIEIDCKLAELNNICPNIVSEYLLLQRSITRNQQYKIINTNILYIYDEMNNQLIKNQYITTRFLDSIINCIELKKIIVEG